MTLRELAIESESVLRAGPHAERARLDAETLLLHLLGQSRAWLLAHWSDAVPPKTQAALSALVSRRAAGEPIQYITGETEFFGMPFVIAPEALIPRPETEHLVEEVLRLSATFGPSDKLHIADIGTGSGAIAVALARSLATAHITATDLSPQALVLAKQNADRNRVANRIEFFEGDLLTPLTERTFNIIASNPPYIPLRDHDSLSIEVREHEPHSALFAGDDGLAIYRRLIPDAYVHLVPNGQLVMEIGYGQQTAVEELLLASNYREIHFISDYQGIPRVAVGRRD
jgi:release factor glutamine methyltransferase